MVNMDRLCNLKYVATGEGGQEIPRQEEISSGRADLLDSEMFVLAGSIVVSFRLGAK